MRRQSKAVTIGALVFGSFAVWTITFVALRAAFTAWNTWQFSTRPEIENWAVPSIGTVAPAVIWATVIAVMVLASTLMLIRARTRSGGTRAVTL